MRDSLMPSRDSGGKKTVLFLLIGGVVLLLIAGVIIVRQRGAAEEPTPEPVDTGEPVQVNQLVAPQATQPIVEAVQVDTGEAPEDTATSKKPRRHRSKPVGTIDTAEFNKFINSRFGQVKSCYERRLKVNTFLEGKVDVNISINKRGRVNWITVNRDTVKDKEMLSCVRKTIQSWQFPEPDGGGVVFGKTFNFKKKGN